MHGTHVKTSVYVSGTAANLLVNKDKVHVTDMDIATKPTAACLILDGF